MLGDSMSPSPARDSEHTQLMGKSATMTLFVDKVVSSAGLEWDCSSKSSALQDQSLLCISLQMTLGPKGCLYISPTKFKFCQYRSY